VSYVTAQKAGPVLGPFGSHRRRFRAGEQNDTSHGISPSKVYIARRDPQGGTAGGETSIPPAGQLAAERETHMGDKSPKANQKKSSQKQSATSSADQKKKQAAAAKQSLTKKK
jgi:hypothetical protein